MERSVRAILRAEVGSYITDMDRAARATAAVGEAAAKAGTTTSKANETAAASSKQVEDAARSTASAAAEAGKAAEGAGKATTASMDGAATATAAVGEAAKGAAEQTAAAGASAAAAGQQASASMGGAAAATESVGEAAKVAAEQSSAVGQNAAAAGQQAASAMEVAADATRGVSAAAEQAASASRSFAQRLVTSARENEQAWNRVGGALTVTGGAATALMATVLNTGISYNQLRQSSISALTSLTGSAQAANAQMKQLDDFASNSPFARDVFIRAQQQMLGFGIEAQKVIPYLDAIQNAVAAAGGSNHDIAELARIMSQISASAKITATDLREFGNRGVDAATLIGSQMGMTGAEIREAITDGSLDAGQALDALAAGMSATFDGAAAGVKDTFAGAVDRVRAAWRDISSIVAEPLVGREGGGIFTALLNETADLLRSIESLPAPVLQVGGALTGLVGVTGLAAGGFMLMAPRIVATVDAMRELGIQVPDVRGKLGRLDLRGFARRASLAAAAITAMSIAMRGLSSTSEASAGGVEEVRRHLIDLGEAGADISSLFQDIELGWLHRPVFGDNNVVRHLADFETQLRRMTDEGLLEKAERGLGSFFSVWDDSVQGQFEARMGQVNDILTDLVTSGDLETAADLFDNLSTAAGSTDQAALQLINSMPGFRDALIGVATEAGLATDDTTLLKLALGYIAPEADSAATAMHGFEGALAGYASAQEKALDALTEWREMVSDADQSFSDIAGAYQQVIDANRELAEETAAATKSSKDSWEDYYDGVTVSMSDWIAKLEEQAAAQAQWQQNILQATADIREQLPADMHAAADAMLDELIELGPEGAAAIATFTEASAEEKQRLIEAWLGTGQQIVDDFAMELEQARQPELGLSTVPAEEALAGFLGAVENEKAVVVLDGNAVPVEAVLSALRHKILTFDEPLSIDGDDVPVMEVLDAVAQAIANEEEDVTINGNRLPVDRVVGELMAWIARQEASVTVHAETAEAMSRLNVLDSTLNSIDGRTVTASVAIRQYGQAAVASGGYMGDFLAGGGRPRKRYTMGGEVFGPGTPTSDDVPAMLSRKEFVQRAAAVDYYGVDFMYALNAMRIPREQLGIGLAGGGQLREALDGGAYASVRNYSVPVPASLLPRAATSTLPGAQVTVHNHNVPMDVTGRVASDTLFTLRQVMRESGYSMSGV